ncbi:ligase-associated DNA damage response endonuclease PdeM [Azospirillum sp. A39]|uniref:ligase-associated DNA damage response endonuclease PdeM n=1 Tax=Azospirillum sp. A39 TaxID=3462279 RepID=UPI0040455B4D
MTAIELMGAHLVPDPSGALHWPAEETLAVADLHLEKGSHFARHGRLLPPYDTRATLDRLEEAVARLRPRRVLCLGDSFHDRGAAERLDAAERARLRRLTAATDWVWIAGNHDPQPPGDLGGRAAAEVRAGTLTFRHAAAPGAAGEVSGHLHPVAAVHLPGRRVRERCFVSDGQRLILPAFGAYAGGLNVLSPALGGLLARPFEVHLLARGRVHRLPHGRLAPDAA